MAGIENGQAMKDDFTASAIPVAAAIFMSMLGIGMMVPALPELAAGGRDTAVAAGGLIGAYGFARLLFNTPSGILTDRIGIRTSAYVGLLLLAANSILGFMTTSFSVLLVVMAVQGAASSLFSTAAMTALVLKAGPKGRGRAMAWFQTSLLLGFAIGPVFGGQIVDHFTPHTPFIIQSVIALLALTAVRAMANAPEASGGQSGAPGGPQGAKGAGGPPPVGFGSLWSRALVIGGIGGFAAFFCRFGIAWNLVPVSALQQFRLSNSELGWIIGVGTVANVMVTPFLGKLIDGWGAKPAFLSAALLNVVGMAMLFAAPGHAMLWIATAVILFATGIMIPSAGAMALTNARPQAMGRTMGLFRTMGESGMAFGPVVVPGFTAAAHLPILGGLIVCIGVTVVALIAASLFSARKAVA